MLKSHPNKREDERSCIREKRIHYSTRFKTEVRNTAILSQYDNNL